MTHEHKERITGPGPPGAPIPPPFSASVTRAGAERVVALTGELDLATAGPAERALRLAEHGGTAPVVVDLSGLAFMDAQGLRLLVSARTRLGDRMVVRPGPRAVQRVFELTGTASLFAFGRPLS